LGALTYGKLLSYGYGYGSGYGYGYGDGSGSGYGYGYGYGYGDGYGDGSGSGYGDGYGSGYGYGYGSGSGSGYGYGYGDGSGSGYGLKEATVGFLAMLSKERRARAKKLLREGAKLAYWKSDKDGRPANGGSAEPAHVGLVQTSPGPLNLCNPGTLHATYRLDVWNGTRIWLVAMIGKIVEQEDKVGALQREFLAELTDGKLV
jgi:hypothetical protein